MKKFHFVTVFAILCLSSGFSTINSSMNKTVFKSKPNNVITGTDVYVNNNYDRDVAFVEIESSVETETISNISSNSASGGQVAYDNPGILNITVRLSSFTTTATVNVYNYNTLIATFDVTSTNPTTLYAISVADLAGLFIEIKN